MTEIKWQEPGPDPRGGTRADEVADALRQNPGRWALVDEAVDTSAAEKWQKRGLEATRRRNEAASAGQRTPKYDVYARFVPEADA